MSGNCELFRGGAGKVLCKCRPFSISPQSVRSEIPNAKRPLGERPWFNHAAYPINKTGSSANEILTALLDDGKWNSCIKQSPSPWRARSKEESDGVDETDDSS